MTQSQKKQRSAKGVSRLGPGVVDRDVERAWSESQLADVSATAKEELLNSSVIVHLAPGELLTSPFGTPYSAGGGGVTGVLIDGALRLYLTSESRQVTLQYIDAGVGFGLPSAFAVAGSGEIVPGAQALSECRVLMLSPTVFHDLVHKDVTVASALVEALRGALAVNVGLLAENVLQPLRRRIARHLLDLAIREGDDLVVAATVQDIADATGTVREVVTRLLKGMREAGLIARHDGALVIADPRALHLVAQGEDPRSQGIMHSSPE